MRYWYKKERQECGGMVDFHGHREMIYKGKDKPEKLIVRYLEFSFRYNEPPKEYYDRFENTVKTLSSQEHLDEYENGSDIYTKTWNMDWKTLTDYNEVHYSHNPTDTVEITKEKFEMIIQRGKRMTKEIDESLLNIKMLCQKSLLKNAIKGLIHQTKDNLQKLEDDSLKSWDEKEKNNDENFTPKIEKQRQYYFGMIQGLELALQEIK